MEKEINAGYVITDRLTVGNAEFVIGQRNAAPARFVTWKSMKDKKEYYWGQYMNDRLSAMEDLCNRALGEIRLLRSLQPKRDTAENPVRKDIKDKHEPDR